VINLRIEKKKKRKVKQHRVLLLWGGETDTITDVILYSTEEKNEMTKKNKQQRKRAHFDLYKERGNIAGGWRQLEKKFAYIFMGVRSTDR
jgi:hypothetical protein